MQNLLCDPDECLGIVCRKCAVQHQSTDCFIRDGKLLVAVAIELGHGRIQRRVVEDDNAPAPAQFVVELDRGLCRCRKRVAVATATCPGDRTAEWGCMSGLMESIRARPSMRERLTREFVLRRRNAVPRSVTR